MKDVIHMAQIYMFMFPMVATGINGGMCHFDGDNSSLFCDIDSLMWLSSTLMLPLKVVPCIYSREKHIG